MSRLVQVGRRARVLARSVWAGREMAEWTAFRGLLVGLSTQGARAVEVRRRASRRATGKRPASTAQVELPFQSPAMEPAEPPRTDRQPSPDFLASIAGMPWRDSAQALLHAGLTPKETAEHLVRGALGFERLRRDLQQSGSVVEAHSDEWVKAREERGLGVPDAGTRPTHPAESPTDCDPSRPGATLPEPSYGDPAPANAEDA